MGEALRLLEVVERKREQLSADVLEGIISGESISRAEIDRTFKQWAEHRAADVPAVGE